MDTDNPHVKTALRTIVMEPTLMRNIQILCAETEHDIVRHLPTKKETALFVYSKLIFSDFL